MARWLVLDLDGTLVDSVPDLAASLNRLMASRGLAAFDETAVTGMVGDGVRALVERGFAARDTAIDSAAVADFMLDYTESAAQRSRPYPGVRDTLATLQAQGWTMAVCTNKPLVPAQALLQALALAPFFATVAGGDSFPVRKPDPAHLLSTLAACKGDPKRAVMVGDHHNDIHAAHGAGVASIWAQWGYGAGITGATAVAASFSELPAILNRLMPL